MTQLLVATNNRGKILELERLLQGTGLCLVGLGELGIAQEIDESGASFAENARLKAEGYGKLAGLLTVADDSGLEVDALGGEPGVLSARYGGLNNDRDRLLLVLERLGNLPPEQRTARFRSVVAVSLAGGAAQLFEGVIEGQIATEPRGENGFGYDPIFLPLGTSCTMAELSLNEKNEISHRSLALRRALPCILGFR